MLQTLLDRDSNLEEVNKFISANVMKWERGQDSLEDTLLSPMELSSLQEEMVEEKIPSSQRGDVEKMLS